MCSWFQARSQRKWNPLSIALSPLSPQEKMEIANIEPTQSIPLSRKGLRGMLFATEQDWWREEWAIARVCQVSSALCDTQLSDSSATLDLVWKLSLLCSHTLFLSLHFPLLLSCAHSFFPFLSASHSIFISLLPPLGCHFAAYGSPTQVFTHALPYAFAHATLHAVSFLLFIHSSSRSVSLY